MIILPPKTTSDKTTIDHDIPADSHNLMLSQNELRRTVSRIRFDAMTGDLKTFPSLNCSKDLAEWRRVLEEELQTSGISPQQWSDAAMLFLEDDLKLEMRSKRNNYVYSLDKQIWTWEQFLVELWNILNERDSRPSRMQQFREDYPMASTAAKVAGTGMVVAGGAILGPAIVVGGLNAVGFTASGVAGGSIAAGLQSALYGGATSGVFSLCQSIGATAVVAGPGAVISAAGSLAAGIGLLKGPKKDEDDPLPDVSTQPGPVNEASPSSLLPPPPYREV